MTRARVAALIAATGVTLGAVLAPATAAAVDTIVYPGMTIVQGSTKCTLAFVDTTDRIGYSAGHCDTDTEVRDEAGNRIGQVVSSHNNRVGQNSTGPRDEVIDYEAISLAAPATDLLGPAFTRPLIVQTGLTAEPGMPVCHRGATTGRSCGVIAEVYDGWFTIDPGGYDLISDHGDSGGPVYTYTRASGPDPVLIGIFRGLHGQQLVAVSWPDTELQAVFDAAAPHNT